MENVVTSLSMNVQLSVSDGYRFHVVMSFELRTWIFIMHMCLLYFHYTYVFMVC
jgi:hypothetical protein